MKKIRFKALVLAFVLSLSLAFTGCGSGGTALEKMLADESAQQMANALSGDGVKVEMLSENGNVLIYRFTYEDQLDVTDEIVSILNQGIDAQNSTFTSTLSSLRSELKMSDLTIRLEYCNSDGSVIVSRTFN